MFHNHAKMVILFFLACTSVSHAMKSHRTPQTYTPTKMFVDRMRGLKNVVCPCRFLCSTGFFETAIYYAASIYRDCCQSGAAEQTHRSALEGPAFYGSVAFSGAAGAAYACFYNTDYRRALAVARETCPACLCHILADPQATTDLNETELAAIRAALAEREHAELCWRHK